MTLVAAGIGLLSGCTGVGGGVFLTPILIALRKAPIKTIAAVTAPFILVNSLAGLAGSILGDQRVPPLAPTFMIAAILGGASDPLWARHDCLQWQFEDYSPWCLE